MGVRVRATMLKSHTMLVRRLPHTVWKDPSRLGSREIHRPYGNKEKDRPVGAMAWSQLYGAV